MVGETRIIAFGSGEEASDREEILLTEEVRSPEPATDADFDEGQKPTHARSGWIAPTIAVGGIAAWTGVFVWARQAEVLSAPQFTTWTGLISDWAVPVLLICTIWLLFMRNSRREALRFGDTARALAEESNHLEARLSAVNRELSLAREFIASQSRDLEALGRIASERLSKNAGELQDLIRDNSSRIETIGTVSETALDNMEKLRGQLPVIASSAKDITNNIGSAGRTAHSHLAELISGFDRLSEYGQASERQVDALRGAVEEAIAEFSRQCEHFDEIVSSRFAALAERGTEFRSQLDAQETDVLNTIRSRASALAEELEQTRRLLDEQEAESLTSLRARLSALRDESAAMSRAMRESEKRSIDSWRAGIEELKEETASVVAALEKADGEAVDAAKARLRSLAAEAEAFEERIAGRNQAFDGEMQRRSAVCEDNERLMVSRLSERLATLDAEIAERQSAHEGHSTAIATRSEEIAARLAECEGRMAEIAALSEQAEARVAAGLDGMAGKLSDARSRLTGAGDEIHALTDASVRLLELIEGSANLSREHLQSAISEGDEKLVAVESRMAHLVEAVRETDEHGAGLLRNITESQERLERLGTELGERNSALVRQNEAHEAKLAELREAVEAIESHCESIADKAQGELSEAISKLRASAQEAAAAIGETGATTVSELAARLGHDSAAAIDKAMHITIAETTGQLEQAAAHAAGVGREATIQLRDQLAKVNELVGNLERRVSHARARAEEQVDNDFARRAALITESLNSNAIDIARAISADVSDTAWASYLRGDRGIFTRRAVSLLENGEARTVANIFERDEDFRAHVSRYIHDFEAILRQVLSTRDGHALGVTLLSSDMGKLYVALAQSVERLRE